MAELEKWQVDFEWLRIRHMIKNRMGRPEIPDLQTTLFLIGAQEFGRFPEQGFTKEEKQDLMHVAVCTLLEGEYYEFEGRDQDGWPHFRVLKKFITKGLEEQEDLLIRRIIDYFGKEVE